MGLLFFIFVISFSLTVLRTAAKSNRHQEHEEKNFWSRETSANFARRQDISKLDYLQIPMDKLPLEQLNALGMSRSVEKLTALSKEKIINLSQYSNTDLKLMYGPANLEDLTYFDTNFTSLIRLLDQIGKDLIAAGQNDLALTFFEYAVSIGSDITSTFTALGSLYAKKGETAKLTSLIKTAEGITSLSGPIIVTKLNNIK
ncbi:MAG: hypothetical protein NC225_04075 [Clostridium sp.]|nr:hypothetical protein [Clostridium sp.]MCM1398644.1 hypothetical protein [Clostridium sp.]MCM1459930.1 hypothetical protein [Bacteroides sp.]